MVRILLGPALTPLYLYASTFRSMCAVPNMAIFCSYYYYYYYYYIRYVRSSREEDCDTGDFLVVAMLHKKKSATHGFYMGRSDIKKRVVSVLQNNDE